MLANLIKTLTNISYVNFGITLAANILVGFVLVSVLAHGVLEAVVISTVTTAISYFISAHFSKKKEMLCP